MKIPILHHPFFSSFFISKSLFLLIILKAFSSSFSTLIYFSSKYVLFYNLYFATFKILSELWINSINGISPSLIFIPYFPSFTPILNFSNIFLIENNKLAYKSKETYLIKFRPLAYNNSSNSPLILSKVLVHIFLDLNYMYLLFFLFLQFHYNLYF